MTEFRESTINVGKRSKLNPLLSLVRMKNDEYVAFEANVPLANSDKTRRALRSFVEIPFRAFLIRVLQ